MTKDEARVYNLKIRILKFIIDNKKDLTYQFNSEELTQNKMLYFREKDLDLIMNFMDKNEKIYQIKDENEFNKFLKMHNNVANENYESLFKTLEEEYKQEQQYIKERNYESAWEFANNCKDIGYKLYWIKLPEFDEYLYVNSGMLPDTEEFFNHIHILEDLYILLKDPKPYSKKGDENLNQEIEFKIYTRRWGHDDYYAMERTKDGWKVYGYGATPYETDRKATALVEHILEHDSMIYPHNIKDIFESLWEKADEDMSIFKLKECIEEITDWISLVEYRAPKCIRKEGLL